MQAMLPKFFSFKSAADLVRLGRNNDGGYLVSQADIAKTDFLIGLGINDDWSFESDFTKINNVPVHAYDGSLNFKFWMKHWKKLIPFKIFFSGKNKHIKKFVGINTTGDEHCTLSSILDNIDSQNIFLKIDIEGSEYRIFDEIIANQNRITGVALELHDCDLHLDRIERFIKTFDLKLVHIHANNCDHIKLDDESPTALELTFSKHGKLADIAYLPHKLDMPNRTSAPEIQLIIQD